MLRNWEPAGFFVHRKPTARLAVEAAGLPVTGLPGFLL
jgi:hypothetical protein